FFARRRRHTTSTRDWSSDVCSSDLDQPVVHLGVVEEGRRRAVAVGDPAVDLVRNQPQPAAARELKQRRDLRGGDDPAGWVGRRKIGRASCREREEIALLTATA